MICLKFDRIVQLFYVIPSSFVKVTLFFPLLITAMAHGQYKNAVIQLKAAPAHSLHSMQGEVTAISNIITTLDSIANTFEMTRSFCQVYSKTMENIEAQLKGSDSSSRMFIHKFENVFLEAFLMVIADGKNGDLSSAPEWKCFFSNPNALAWQRVLLAVNAHTNVNIWQAMVANFSENEIRNNKKQYLELKYAVGKVYDDFFDTLLLHNSNLRFINAVTFGLAKKFGQKTMFKWRRRNVNMSIQYYRNRDRFNRRLAIVNRKKIKIDQRILSYR